MREAKGCQQGRDAIWHAGKRCALVAVPVPATARGGGLASGVLDRELIADPSDGNIEKRYACDADGRVANQIRTTLLDQLGANTTVQA